MRPTVQKLICAVAACALFATALWAQAPASQAPPPPPGSPLDLVRQGRQLNNQGKQDEALALYTKALETDPTLYDAHLAAGIALDLKGDYAKARQHLKKAVELATPEQKNQALRTLGMSYAFDRKGGEAEKCHSQIFDANVAKPDYPAAAEIANELARVLLESGDEDAATRWYQKGYETAMSKADLKPEEKDLWGFRWEHAQARIAARRGKKDDAQKHVALAKAIFDKGAITSGQADQTRFWPYLTGYVAFYAGDMKTAIAELEKADQRDPFILSLLAQASEKTGDRAKTMEYYTKAMASNAHNPTNAFARPLARKKLAQR